MTACTIAITQGDAAGIGPEIIAKAFRDAPDLLHGCFVVGDVPVMRRAALCIAQWGAPESALTTVSGQLPLAIALIASPDEAVNVPPRCIPVLQISELKATIPCGHVSHLAGKLGAECVQWAARAALRGEVAALVTAPLHKEALAAAGVPFPGHTELLQAEAAAFSSVAPLAMPVRMMLANEELRTVLVSIHLSLREALDAVTVPQVLQTLQITHAALAKTLGRAPRIGVAGLNPHAGEGGLFGREEVEVIAPAIAQARLHGIDAHGPYAPDTVFMRARHTGAKPGEFDVVVAMYHDQGLIPVKYLGVEQGVNVTLGLHGPHGPLIRTSPDHGTAFDIAGTGRADASSLLAAIRMARQLVGM